MAFKQDINKNRIFRQTLTGNFEYVCHTTFKYFLLFMGFFLHAQLMPLVLGLRNLIKQSIYGKENIILGLLFKNK